MSKKASKLSDEDTKQSLGSIKKKKVKMFRNSLAFPYNLVWPEVDLEECEALFNILEKLLPEAKINCPKLEWKKIIRLSKEDRKKKYENEKGEQTKNYYYRSLIIPGYSAVMRGLEKDEISCCLLAKEVEPQILLKNMVMLAQNKQVPVVIIPSLKDVLKKTLSFSAISLGIKNTVEGDSNCLLHPIIKLVHNMNEKFSRIEKQNQQISSPKKIESTQVRAITRTDCKTNYHLQINSPRGPRVFIPPRTPSTNCDISTDNIKNSLLFIPISKDDSDSDKPNPKKNKTPRFHKFAEESDNDDDIASDEELFKIDTNPDNSMQEMSEELELKPKQVIKRKAEKELNIGYIPTKIKITKSNPSKLKKKN